MDKNEIIQSITEKVKDTANVSVVFGDPIETDGGVTIIPVASVKVSGGGGGGSGRNRKQTEEEGNEIGTGMGLGVKVAATPLGYIEVKDGEARFVQVMDTTKIAVSAMVTASIAMLMVARLMRFKAWKRRMRIARKMA